MVEGARGSVHLSAGLTECINSVGRKKATISTCSTVGKDHHNVVHIHSSITDMAELEKNVAKVSLARYARHKNLLESGLMEKNRTCRQLNA